MEADIEAFRQKLGHIRRGAHRGRVKPHQPLMLLAVLDLFDARAVTENQIFYSPELTEVFAEYFSAIAQPDDWCQPGPPFFHLRSSGFWQHKPRPGHELAYSQLTTSGGGSRRIVDNIEYAYLDPSTFALFQNPAKRDEIRALILEQFFTPDERGALWQVIGRQRVIGGYEAILRTQTKKAMQEPVEYVIRDAAFRRVVLEGYDYQCAACGLRILLPDVPSPIDAAHIVPWSKTHDDSPTNGLALCKLHHWALDVGLLFPTLELRWKVSQLLDSRRNSERELTRFDGLPLLLPKNKSLYPNREAIRWRLESLENEA